MSELTKDGLQYMLDGLGTAHLGLARDRGGHGAEDPGYDQLTEMMDIEEENDDNYAREEINFATAEAVIETVDGEEELNEVVIKINSDVEFGPWAEDAIEEPEDPYEDEEIQSWSLGETDDTIVSYALGEDVWHNGTEYTADQEHDADAGVNEPGRGSAWWDYWTVIGDHVDDEETTLDEWEDIIEGEESIDTEYEDGDYVTNEGDLYICTQTHMAHVDKEPGVGADWETYWSFEDEGYDIDDQGINALILCDSSEDGELLGYSEISPDQPEEFETLRVPEEGFEITLV